MEAKLQALSIAADNAEYELDEAVARQDSIAEESFETPEQEADIQRRHNGLDDQIDQLQGVLDDALASSKVPAVDVATRYSELGDALLPLLNPVLKEKYGLELGSFIVENVSVPEEVEKAIDKRSSMAAVGNLNDYVKFQMAESLGKGDGAGGVAGSAAQLGAGLALGQQLAASMAHPPASAATSPGAVTAPAGGVIPDLMGPAEAARALGVEESDVLVALGDGSLKGKRIGTQWRITRAAIDEFLKS